MTFLDCTAYESRSISEIVRGWLAFAGSRPEYKAMKTTMLHLVELADGCAFRAQDLDDMRALIDRLDDSKPDVKAVKAWFTQARTEPQA